MNGKDKKTRIVVLFPTIVNEKYELPDNYVHKKIIIKSKLKNEILDFLKKEGVTWQKLKKVYKNEIK